MPTPQDYIAVAELPNGPGWPEWLEVDARRIPKSVRSTIRWTGDRWKQWWREDPESITGKPKGWVIECPISDRLAIGVLNDHFRAWLAEKGIMVTGSQYWGSVHLHGLHDDCQSHSSYTDALLAAVRAEAEGAKR